MNSRSLTALAVTFFVFALFSFVWSTSLTPILQTVSVAGLLPTGQAQGGTPIQPTTAFVTGGTPIQPTGAQGGGTPIQPTTALNPDGTPIEPTSASVQGGTLVQPTTNPLPVGSTIESQYPPNMLLEQSSSIRITLSHYASYAGAASPFVPHGVNQPTGVQSAPAGGAVISGPLPTILPPGFVALAATAPSIGTPNAPLGGEFGVNYDAFLIGKLGAAGFEVVSSHSEQQALDHDPLIWEWSIRPKIAGPQRVSMALEIQYQSPQSGKTIEREIWRENLSINVTSTVIPISIINFSTALNVLLTVVLSVLAILQNAKQLRSAPSKSKKKSKS